LQKINILLILLYKYKILIMEKFQKNLFEKNILSKIDDNISFFEYKKDWNIIFYISFEWDKKIEKNESKILWNRWTSNIIISIDINNSTIYIWDIRNFNYNKNNVILEKIKEKNIVELLSSKNNSRYEFILENISNSIKNNWNYAQKFNNLLGDRKKENTVNTELLNDLKQVFQILKEKNKSIKDVWDIDKILVKVILQMLFVCFLKDNEIDIIPLKIKNIKDIYEFLKEIKNKFNWELFAEEQLDIWKNKEFNNEENFDVFKKLFFDRTWNFKNEQLSINFRDSKGKLFFEKYDFKYIPTLLISNIYEWLLAHIHDKSNKKNLWIFYTRPNVVKSILDRYLKNDLNKYDFENTFPKIYDPTCWSWVFLVSAFELIITHLEKFWKKLDFNKRKKILEETIFWSDLEENSIYITEFSLYLELLKWIWNDYKNKENKFPNLIKTKNLIKWDSLLWWEFDNESEKLVIKDLKKIKFRYKFDYIFWNPPWSKCLFSNEYKKEIEKKLKIKSVEVSEYFIIKSKEYVKDWWKICLLTNSKNYYRNKWDKFRRFLLENFVLDELINFNNINEFLFENTKEPATLISLINDKKEDYITKVFKIEETNFSKYYIFTIDWKNIEISKEELLKNIDKWWILYKWDKYDLNLINNLIKNKKTLDDVTTNRAFSWFQISTEKDKKELFNNSIENLKNKNNDLFIEIDDIDRYKINNKNKFINYKQLIKENQIFHIIYKNKNISSIKNRINSKDIFIWNKILFNSKNKLFSFIKENAYFLSKTYVLKFNNKKENYYFYILWILNSHLINNYFIENYTSRKSLEWWKFQELLAKEVKNIPIPNFDENNELFKKISNLAKEIYDLYQEKYKEKEIKLKEEELDKYVMIAYNIFSEIDKQIIKDFSLENWENNIKENIDLKAYWNLFIKHFIDSRAWILMKRQWIIWKNIDYKYWNDSILWLSWVCFGFNNWKIKEKFDNLSKELLLSSLESKNIFEWIENSRVYLPEKKYLFIIKPNKRKYWTLSNAYKDSLYENELIFKNIKIK